MTFHRFNEPLADQELIFKRVSQVRELLPLCTPMINTNGDYITDKMYMLELIDKGVRRIIINLYLNKSDSFFNKHDVYAKFLSFFERVKVEHTKIHFNQYMHRYECSLTDKNICNKASVSVKIQNFELTALNMAGAVVTGRKQERFQPCPQPFEGVFIDYNGYVMPCCMMRHDIEEHKYAILGNIKDNSIFELFCGKKMTEFRKQVKYHGQKYKACRYCDLYAGTWMGESCPLL